MRWPVVLVVLATAGAAGCGTTRGISTSEHVDTPAAALSDSELRFAASLAHYCHGIMCLHSNEDSRRAISDFTRAADLNPEHAHVYIRIVRTMLSRSRYTDALRLLDRISAASPNSASIHAEAGFLRQLCADFEGARKEYELAIRLAPGEAAGYSGLFHIAIFQNDLNEAERLLKQAAANVTDLDPMLDSYRRMVYALMKNGRVVDATDYLEFLNKNDPEDLSVILALFKNYILLDRRKEAVAILVSIADGIPDNLFLQYSIAEVLLPAGYNAEAAAAFERVDALLANDPDQEPELSRGVLYYHYGIACERLRRYEKAAQLFMKSIDLDPALHEVRNYLAYMWAEQNTNLDQALVHVREALKSEPDNAAYIDTLGWIYFRQQQYEEARVQIERAISLLPDDPTVTDHLGDVFMALDRPDEALKFWQDSFILDPDNKAVEQKLKLRNVNTRKLRTRAKSLQDKTGDKPSTTTTGGTEEDSD